MDRQRRSVAALGRRYGTEIESSLTSRNNRRRSRIRGLVLSLHRRNRTMFELTRFDFAMRDPDIDRTSPAPFFARTGGSGVGTLARIRGRYGATRGRDQ